MAELPGATDPGKPPRFVAAPVVGQHPPHRDAAPPKPPECGREEDRTGAAPLRPPDVDVGEAGRVINGDMDMFTADAARVIDFATVRTLTPAASAACRCVQPWRRTRSMSKWR